MLKRFFFDLVRHDTILPDETGVEVVSLSDALEQAIRALAELCDGGEVTEFDDGWTLLIRNEAGTALETLSVK